MQDTIITEVTEAAEAVTGQIKSSSTNIANLVILFIILALCAVGYLWYKSSLKKGGINNETAALKTAQDFINVFDLDDKCLNTVDGMCFMYIKIDGMSLELYEQDELYNMSKNLAKGLVSVDFPWKFISVSRPMDIKETLQNYTELQSTSSAGHKALLQQEINELINMTKRGETLERQHYAVIWDKDDKDQNISLKKKADKLTKVFSDNKIHCEMLNNEEIKSLLNFINIPAYSHLETRYDFGDELLRAIIR